MIELKDVHKTYWMGDNEVRALRGVSLFIEKGDYIAIMGPSGSGKSTLMNVIGFLDVPDSGSYSIDGREVSSLDQEELAELRREAAGFVFQQFNLLPRMSLFENVSLPLLYSRLKLGSSWVLDLIERVGLKERVEHRPNELSGGQQQRVAIARALVNRPRIVLADEPTGNLDSVSENEIMGLLDELNAQGITIVIVTHEDEIARHAKRLIRMRDGQVISDERREAINKNEASKQQSTQLPLKKRFQGFLEIFDYFHQGIRALSSNKVRAFLSMLGIMIGVSAVVTMLAIGAGARDAINTQLASLGSNLLILRPGAVRVGGVTQEAGATTRLTLQDIQAVKDEIPYVKDVTPEINGRAQVAFADKNWSTQVLGAAPSYATMRASVPDIGRFFTEAENQKRSRVVVLGATVVRSLFGERDPIGEMIKINKVNFQVIGILPVKGASTFRDQDDIVIVPVTTAMFRLLGKDYIDFADIEISDNSKMDEAQQNILALMYARHRVPLSQQQDAFEIRNLAEIQAVLTQSNRTLSLLLAFVAAISLLVGGIGIMNIMLVSVTERTREIGLRKALGAKSKDILAQFLAESVVVSALGGFFGIALAWAASTALSAAAGWTAPISLSSVALAVIFSCGIGIVFGLYPARKASKLHPIEALRFE